MSNVTRSEHEMTIGLDLGDKFSSALANLGDTPDKSVAVDRRDALAHAVATADIDQNAAQEGAAGIADDPAGDEGCFGFRCKVQQAAQPRVFAL